MAETSRSPTCPTSPPRSSWTSSRRRQDWLLDRGVLILLTIVLAVVARWALHRIIGRAVDTMSARSTQRSSEKDARGNVLATTTGLSAERQRARVQTVGSLLRSVSTFVIAAVAGLTVMDLVGLPLGPLLASAGVAGVAIGFGAQSLVKDFLSGDLHDLRGPVRGR